MIRGYEKTEFFLVAGWLFHLAVWGQAAEQMDLSGIWRFQLDPMGFGKTPGSELYLSKLTETIALPGSTDEGGKGIQNFVAHVDRLSRKFEYCGQAWYQREVVIPESWREKDIVLSLERCHWETTVYVDGSLVGADERLSTPNRFVVTGQLTPGLHTLTVCVDNRLKYPMDQWNHGTTEYTQTNWNGMVGQLKLEAYPACAIRGMRVDTDIDSKKVMVRLRTGKAKEVPATLELRVKDKTGKVVGAPTSSVVINGSTLVQECPVKGDMVLWNEFTPELYTLEAALTVEGETYMEKTFFGFRKVEQGKHHIRLNGRNIHLRGVLDCAVFPRTGYPATDVASWAKIFRTVKEYGMNHVRFHSWCPPEAAFFAADSLGLSDFPGQGSAFVGILEAFWESKGLVTPEKFRESCAPVVLLARFPKRTYLNNEVLRIKLGVYQFADKAIKGGALQWSLEDEGQHAVAEGKLRHGTLSVGTVDSLGAVAVDLKAVARTGKYTFRLRMGDEVKNEWDFWVYAEDEINRYQEFRYVRNWEEARDRLLQGESVLFVPEKTNGRTTRFTGHFWNPVMFNWDPMIVGTWIDQSHPALDLFPTSYYADWQWWDILNYGQAVDLTELRELQPVIQSVDTYEVNRKLGISFEAKVGMGKLFVLCLDMDKGIHQRLAMKQLLTSVGSYVFSDRFVPRCSVPVYRLDEVFSLEKEGETVNKDNAAVRQLLNQ